MNIDKKKENKISFISLPSTKLINKQIKEICLLKDMQWKFGLKSQLKWFSENIKKKDLHNLLYIKSKLIGYTLLRKRTCKIPSLNQKLEYLLFDTLIIDRKYRGVNISKLLMNFNNATIKQLDIISFLVCEDKLINFYKKNNWKKLSKNKFDVADHKSSSNGMIFNSLNLNKKHIFYVNK